MNHEIIVEGGTSVLLPTAGMVVRKNIIITAEGGGGTENLDSVLTEQETLIEELREVLEGKASGGGGGGQPMEMVATFADGTTKTYVIYGEIAE